MSDISFDPDNIMKGMEKFLKTENGNQTESLDTAIAAFSSSSTSLEAVNTKGKRREQVEVLTKIRSDINELESLKTDLRELKWEMVNEDKVCNEIIDLIGQPLESDSEEREQQQNQKKKSKKPKKSLSQQLSNIECVDLVQEDSTQDFLDSIFPS